MLPIFIEMSNADELVAPIIFITVYSFECLVVAACVYKVLYACYALLTVEKLQQKKP